jgi:hypothetical protein
MYMIGVGENPMEYSTGDLVQLSNKGGNVVIQAE